MVTCQVGILKRMNCRPARAQPAAVEGPGGRRALCRPVGVDDLAAAAGLSRAHFSARVQARLRRAPTRLPAGPPTRAGCGAAARTTGPQRAGHLRRRRSASPASGRSRTSFGTRLRRFAGRHTGARHPPASNQEHSSPPASGASTGARRTARLEKQGPRAHLACSSQVNTRSDRDENRNHPALGTRPGRWRWPSGPDTGAHRRSSISMRRCSAMGNYRWRRSCRAMPRRTHHVVMASPGGRLVLGAGTSRTSSRAG